MRQNESRHVKLKELVETHTLNNCPAEPVWVKTLAEVIMAYCTTVCQSGFETSHYTKLDSIQGRV